MALRERPRGGQRQSSRVGPDESPTSPSRINHHPPVTTSGRDVPFKLPTPKRHPTRIGNHYHPTPMSTSPSLRAVSTSDDSLAVSPPVPQSSTKHEVYKNGYTGGRIYQRSLQYQLERKERRLRLLEETMSSVPSNNAQVVTSTLSSSSQFFTTVKDTVPDDLCTSCSAMGSEDSIDKYICIESTKKSNSIDALQELQESYRLSRSMNEEEQEKSKEEQYRKLLRQKKKIHTHYNHPTPLSVSETEEQYRSDPLHPTLVEIHSAYHAGRGTPLVVSSAPSKENVFPSSSSCGAPRSPKSPRSQSVYNSPIVFTTPRFHRSRSSSPAHMRTTSFTFPSTGKIHRSRSASPSPRDEADFMANIGIFPSVDENDFVGSSLQGNGHKLSYHKQAQQQQDLVRQLEEAKKAVKRRSVSSGSRNRDEKRRPPRPQGYVSYGCSLPMVDPNILPASSSVESMMNIGAVALNCIMPVLMDATTDRMPRKSRATSPSHSTSSQNNSESIKATRDESIKSTREESHKSIRDDSLKSTREESLKSTREESLKSTRDELTRLKYELSLKKLQKEREKLRLKGLREDTIKRVRFATPLVSDIRHRPFTRAEDIGKLFFGEDELDVLEADRAAVEGDQFELALVSEDSGDEQMDCMNTSKIRPVSVTYRNKRLRKPHQQGRIEGENQIPCSASDLSACYE